VGNGELKGEDIATEADHGFEFARRNLSGLASVGANKSAPVYPPESIRPRRVYDHALALREKLRPSLSTATKEERNSSALIYLKLLEAELNPNRLPPSEQAAFRGPVVVRESLTDLRDFCYALAKVWSEPDIWSGESTTTPMPLEMPHPPAELVERLVDVVERLGAALPQGEPVVESAPARAEPFEIDGWLIVEDAPAERVASLPRPANGRFVVALPPPAINEVVEMHGEQSATPRRPHLALLWTNQSGDQVLSDTGDGLLLGHHRKDATWLPDGWEMDYFPAGWGLPHLDAGSTSPSTLPASTVGTTSRPAQTEALRISRHPAGWWPTLT
jgi:hypothetical protein